MVMEENSGIVEKAVEWLGSIGKIAIAIGAALGVAIGVAALIWQNFMNRNKLKQGQQIPIQQLPAYSPYIYGGSWAY